MLAAILAATILLLSGKKKRVKTSKDIKAPIDSNIRANLILPKHSKGEPWSRCDPPKGSPKGTQAAFGKDGQCMVFWQPETDSVVRQTIQQALLSMPKSKRDSLCAVSKCKDDPFALESQALCEWIPDPDRTEFVKQITISLWPQVTSQMLPPPPPDALGRINSPYFVLYVWTLVMNIFAQEFCGFNPVT